jgi:hypothetical protein
MPIIKTAVQQQWNQILIAEPHVKVVAKANVDGFPWYTVKCSKEAASWLRQQGQEQWHQHIDHNWYTVSGMFDIDEETYIMLKLQWGEQ